MTASSTTAKRSKTMHPCPYPDCNKVYTQKPKLTDHIRSHTGEKPFACPFPGCGKTYRRNGQLTVHCRLHDPKTTRTFECNTCGQTFNLKHHLKRHEETIHQVPLSFRCDWPDCSAAYTKKYQLRRHMCIHTNKKPHPCLHPGCDASFEYKSRLQYHQDTVHSDIQRYVCTESDCGRKFTKWSELQTHVHSSHPVECEVCHKVFLRRALLTRHMKGAHLLTGRVNCEWEGCGKSFSSKKALRHHMKSKHNPVSRFRCTFENCDQTFHFRAYWLKHEKTHKKHEDHNTSSTLETPNTTEDQHGNQSTTKVYDGEEQTPVTENEREATSTPAKKPNTRQLTLMEQLTGFKYNNDSARKYSCPFDGCNHKFVNQYGLKRHLQSKLHKLDVEAYAVPHGTKDKAIDGLIHKASGNDDDDDDDDDDSDGDDDDGDDGSDFCDNDSE
ncbi:unnamed protein product [Absidia cylindrospora]